MYPIRGRIRKALLIVYLATSSRMTDMLIGSVVPGRSIVIMTVVPRGPLILETTSLVDIFSVDSPFTRLITSPTRSPTFSAGESLNGGDTTVTLPKRDVMV